MYDVEMTGRLGYSCHVFVVTDSTEHAEKLAKNMFPELEVSGNTVRADANAQ